MCPCMLHIRGRIVTERNATHEKRIRIGQVLRKHVVHLQHVGLN